MPPLPPGVAEGLGELEAVELAPPSAAEDVVGLAVSEEVALPVSADEDPASMSEEVEGATAELLVGSG